MSKVSLVTAFESFIYSPVRKASIKVTKREYFIGSELFDIIEGEEVVAILPSVTITSPDTTINANAPEFRPSTLNATANVFQPASLNPVGPSNATSTPFQPSDATGEPSNATSMSSNNSMIAGESISSNTTKPSSINLKYLPLYKCAYLSYYSQQTKINFNGKETTNRTTDGDWMGKVSINKPVQLCASSMDTTSSKRALYKCYKTIVNIIYDKYDDDKCMKKILVYYRQKALYITKKKKSNIKNSNNNNNNNPSIESIRA